MHLDLYQRIEVSPASISILRLSFARPSVLQINETSFLSQLSAKASDSLGVERLERLSGLTVEALGPKGKRVFYLQVTDVVAERPFTFIIEKTHALQLASQIEALVGQAQSTPPPLLPFSPPEEIVFHVGRIALEYDSERLCLHLTLTELLGEGQGTPRQLHLLFSPEQGQALAVQARRVAQGGDAI